MLKLVYSCLLVCLVAACNPTIRIEAPAEPIKIQIDATIRIVIEKDVEQVLANDELF